MSPEKNSGSTRVDVPCGQMIPARDTNATSRPMVTTIVVIVDASANLRMIRRSRRMPRSGASTNSTTTIASQLGQPRFCHSSQ